MKKLINFLDTISELTGKFVAVFVFVLLFVVVYEVVSRKVFSAPTIWAFELSYMLYAFIFLIGFGYTLKHKMHIGIDIITQKLSPKKQGVIELIGYIIFFIPFMIVAFKATSAFTIQSWQGLERSQSPWGPVVYPFKTLLPISFVLLSLQGISEMLKSILKIKGEEV